MAQVPGEAVTQIGHRVDGEMLRKPLRFGEAGLEVQMAAEQGTAKLAGDENGVADFRAAAQNLFSAGDGPEEGDGK